MIGTLEIIIILLGLVGFPLACGIFCLWFDYSNDYINYEWEQRKRK